MNELDQFAFMDTPGAAVPPPAQLGADALEQFAFMDEGGDYTLGEYAQQAGSSFVGGLTGTFTGAVKGLGILSERLTGESELDDWATEMEASIQQAVPGVMGLQDSWTGKISGAFGSAAGFVAAGALTGGASAVVGRGLAGVGALGRAAGATAETVALAGQAAGRIGQMTSAGVLGALGNGASRYEEAKMLGKSEDEAWGSYLAGIPIGSLEALPIGLSRSAQRLGRFNKASGDAIRKLTVGQVMLAEGLEEAGQEMLNEGLNQLSDYAMQIKTAEEAFDFQQMLESGVLGFLPGSAIGGLTAKAQIAADMAEQRKAAAEKEAAELPDKLRKQAEEERTQQLEALTAQGAQLNELVAMGEARMAELAPPVAEGAEPPVVTPERQAQIDELTKNLDQIRKQRDIVAKQLEYVGAEADADKKYELAGAYGQARAASELAGLLPEFEAAQQPGAERILNPDEQAKWDAVRGSWKSNKAFAGMNVDAFKLVLPASEAQAKAEKILTDLGQRVEYIDLGEGSETVQGFIQSGAIYLNSRMSEADLLRTVARHEGYHSLFRNQPEEWEATLNKMQEVAPNVFAAAMRKAAMEIASVRGEKPEKLTKFLQTEEGRRLLEDETLSSAADIFSATIDTLRENPALADELIQKDPGFFRRIYEWVKERLNAIGFKFETLSAKEQEALAKLPKLLYATEEGDVEVEASVNERIAGAQTLIALWDRAQAETTVALSSRQRQAKIFAQRTLGDIAARKSVEAKVKEGIDIEDAAAAAERKAAEEKRLAAIAKKRAAEVTRIKNKIKQISVDDEVWPQVEAVGKATTIDERNAAAQNFTASLPDATAEEIDQIAKAVSARYDQVAKKELAKKQREDTAAQRLKDRQAEAAQRKKDAEAAQQRRDAEAKARQAERKAQRAKAAAEREAKQAQQKADREAEKARKAQERQRLAENRKNAAAAKLAERQAEKARKEAEKAQKQADKTAAKVAEQKRLEQEAAAAAEAAAQAEQEAAEARKRRKGERIPRVRRGAIAPGQLSVGDIVNYRNRMAKVIEATGSGLEQRVRLQRLTDSEAERAQTLERPDWWNEVVFAGQVVDVDMTSSDIVSLVASRSETEVLREEGKKMLAARIRAEMERREGDQPRFSVLGSYDDAAVDERYNFALGAVEAFKAGGETMSNAVWSAIHDYKSREYDRGEWDKAIAYYEENGIWSYLEAGQYTIPVQVDVDVEPVLEEDEDGPVFSINLGKKNQAKDRRTGLPRNKNGTVTVYYPTTSDSARKVIASRELVGHTPQATRIYVTNESNGSTVREAPGNIEQPLDGATVLLHIDPALLSVDETYDNGRRDFYISIREGESFKKRMKQIKLFGMSIDKADKIDPSLKLKDLMTRFEGAIEQYRKLKPEKQRARLREAKKALKAQHNVGTLLSENAKLAKTWEKQGLRTPEGKKLRSTGLGLSAAQQISDTIVSCPNAGSCWWLCLGDTSGGNEIYGGEGSNRTGPRLSQFLKTEALALNPENFAIALYAEIDKFAKEVTRSRRAPSVRLNVTSDFPPSLWKPLHDAFPRVMFYDYTKTSAKPISPNHHLTYSGTGWSQEIDGKYYNNRNSNWNLMRIRLSEGFNVALSFTAKKGEDLPETITDSATGKVYKVIDGDTYDARYLDKQPEGQQGVIVGLRNKDDTRAGGKDPLLADFATHSQSLFVYYDSEVHGKNLTVPKQKAAKGVKSSDIAFSVKVRKPTLVVSFVVPRGQAATEAWDAIAEYIENVAYDWDSFYTEENQPDFDAEYLKGYAEEIRDAQNRRGIIIGSNINLFVQERIDDIIDDRRIDNAESVAVLRRIQRRLKIEGYADVSPRMKAQTVLSEWMKLRRKGEGAEGKTSRKLLEYLVAMPEYEPQFGKSGAQLFPSDLEFQQQTVSKIRPLAREILAVNNKRLETIVDLKKGRAFSRLYGGIKLDPRITNESYPFVIIHEIAHQITQYTVNKDLHDSGHFDRSLIGNDYKEQIESNLKAIEFGAVQGSSASGVYRVGSAYLQAVNSYSQIWIENNPDAVAKAGSAEAAKSLYIKSVLGGHPDRALKSKSKGSFNYYMSNVDEFIAGAMSDIEFQKWLNSIPAEGEPGVSLWQKFIEAVSLILGISVDQRSLLAQVLSGVEEIAKTEQPSDIATGPMFSVRASVTPEMDAAYLAAVERGDLDTAQRMVDEAAKASGYTEKGSHGLALGELVNYSFDPNLLGQNTKAASAKLGFFFASKETARSYGLKTLNADNASGIAETAEAIVQPLLKLIPKGASRELDFVRELGNSAFAPQSWDEFNPEDYLDGTIKYVERLLNDAEFRADDFVNQAEIVNAVEQARFLVDETLGQIPYESVVDSAVVDVLLKMQNPYIHDQQGQKYREKTFYEIIAKAKEQGYDSVLIKNTYDGGPLDDVKVVFSPTQIKSADAIIRQKNRVIPLSERFDEDTDDIRFSVRGRDLTPKEREQLVPTAVAFAGGGTFELALADYINPKIAVEANEDIAAAYNTNAYAPSRVAKLGDVSPEDFIGQTLFHASPPCVTSSKLRDGQNVSREEETERGREVAEIIRVAKNPIVVIENVPEYRKSEAFRLIAEALDEVGYTWDAHVYKAQDYGSPSRRQRLFVRAVLQGALPPKAVPTHSSNPNLYEKPFAAWGDAIGDLLPTLPEFNEPLPPYVLKSLAAQGINPESPSKPYYISGTQLYGFASLAPFDKPAPTVVASGAETPRILMPDGRVLRVTPEALKRLMGFGSEFVLPENQKLAKRIVGNGIPRQLTRAVVVPVLESQGYQSSEYMFSVKGKGGGKPKKPKKPKRVSAKAAKAATQSARSAAARLRAAQAAATARARKELPAVKSLLETTIEEGEGTAVGEAPGTAIAAGGEESRAMIRVLRENLREVDAQVLPNLTMDDAARDEAASRLADDYEGVKAELFREIDETGNVSEPWKVYATMLISASEAEKATTGRMTVAKYMAAYEAENRDAIVRRAASANLRVRQDAVVSARRRNQAHVFAETRTLRRNIEKLRKAASEGNKKEREKAERKVAKLRREHAKAVVEAIEDLQQEGYDTEGAFSYLSGGDPVTFARIVRRINDAKVLSDIKGGYVSSVWDAIMEARMASLLSGPATHSANIAGNAAMLTLRTTRQLAEVLTNTVIRDRTSTDFGDFKAYMTGFLRSLGRAGRNLMMAYRTDMPVFEAIISRESALEIAEKTNGIPGLIGRMLRLPSLTTLRAFDEFFKTIAAHTEAASLAYRNGRARGLSGDALEAYIDRVLNDFTDPVWREGLDAALKTVFQDKSDKLTQILLSTRSFLDNNPTTVPVGSYLLPFVKTPLQIFKVGLAMPIHPIIPIFRWVNRKRMGEEYTGKEKVTDSANALVSMALFVAAYTMLGDDDDEESRVTGAAPDIWEERLLSQRTAPAYSIKSSDGEWYTYARIEPFATGFSAMVDGIRAQQRLMRDDVPDKWSQGMSIMFNNVLGQIEDKTFLRTVGDVAKMFRERDQINAAKFARDLFVTPMIPNLMRQTVGNTDPYIRNTTVREYEDKSTWESATQSLSYIAWPDSDRPDAPPMRYDLWGRPIKRSGDSAFARNFSPAQKVYEEDDVHKLDRLIVTFNDKVADGKFGGAVEKYLPRSPEYRINRGKETYILGDEEYARYSKEAGELAAKRLSRARLNYDDPTERDIDRVRDEIARSRKLVVDRILRERRRLPQPQEQEQ